MKIFITMAVVALVGIGFYLMSSKDSSSTDMVKTEEIQGLYSIKDIIAMDKPLQCSFRKNDGAISVTGGILVSGENVRGDFEIEGTPIGPVVSHFIVKDGLSYTWTSLAKVGYKKEIEKEEERSVVGVNEKVEYTCNPWQKDSASFDIPSGITFTKLK